MKKNLLFISSLLFISTITNAIEKEATPTKEMLNKKPLLFMENKGQVIDTKGNHYPEILFTGSGKGVNLYFNTNGITYSFIKSSNLKELGISEDPTDKFNLKALANIKTEVVLMNMELVGCNPNAEIVKEEKSNYIENFYTAGTGKGITNVGGYSKITYKNIYPNIDWVIYSKGQTMKYDFIVHPTGNPDTIKMKYSTPESMKTNRDGSVEVATALGKITEQTPFVYQGEAKEVKSKFTATDNELSFSIDTYNKSQELIIDPGIIWGMYFGDNNSWDIIYSVTEDNAGNIYTAGSIYSNVTAYPGLTYGQQTTVSGLGYNAMLTKFDGNGNPLIATYYGASGNTSPTAIELDKVNEGNLLMVGTTNAGDLLMAGTSAMNYNPGGNTGFLSQWDANLTLVNSTYIGGAGDDDVTSVTNDATGYYICGKTQGLDAALTTTMGGQPFFEGGNYDGFIISIDNSNNIQWASYMGDTGDDFLTDIGIQANNADTLVVVGYTNSTMLAFNMPPLSNNGSSYFGGAYDGLIFKMDKTTGAKYFRRYFGGAGDDKIYSLCIPEYMADAAHHLDYMYIAGTTTSNTSPSLAGSGGGNYDAFYAGGIDIYSIYGSYLGGVGNEGAYSIKAFDGNVYVAGYASGSSTNIATTTGFQPAYAAGADGFVISIGAQTWGTFYGGAFRVSGYTSDEVILDMIINPHVPQSISFYDYVTHVVVAGYSTGSDGVMYNTTSPNLYGDGPGNGIVAKFANICEYTPNPVTITTNTGNNSMCQGTTLDLYASGGGNYVWNTGSHSATITVAATSNYIVTTATAGCTFTQNINITVNPLPSVAVTPSGSQFICQGDNMIFTANSAAAISYQWYLDGNPLSAETNSTINATIQGSYTVEVADANGCTKTSFPILLFVNSPPPAAITSSVTDICTGHTVTLLGNNSTATYNWFKDGNSIPGAFLRNYVATESGTYYVSETSPNGCGATSNSITITVHNYPAPSITAAGIPYTCTGGTVTLTTADTAGYTYQWSQGAIDIALATDTSYVATTGGTYAVTVTNAGICSTASASVDINPTPTPTPICLITVDTASTHNILIWEKPASTAIDSFRIYREVTTNVYAHIASIAYDSLSEYHDYDANPNVTSYKYKLATVDICGQASAMGEFHNTIHLQVLGNGNLQWTNYEIENTANPVHFYRVYRDNLGNGNFIPISATVPGGNTTWTDIFYGSFPNAQYVMDVDWSIGCSPSRVNINTTRSNIKRQAIATGISANEAGNDIAVYPNPTQGIFQVSSLKFQIQSLKVVNMLGEVVFQSSVINHQSSIDMSEYGKGIYFVQIQTYKETVNRKIVVQ